MNKIGYSDSLRSIDEKIVQLLAERLINASGQPYVPPGDQLKQWAEHYAVDQELVKWLFRGLVTQHKSMYPIEVGEIQTVLPIMKKVQIEDFEYTLTHAMQHERASVVHLEVKYTGKNPHLISSIRPDLILNIKPNNNFTITLHGRSGEGANAHMSYYVAPALSNEISKYNFSLVPHSIHPPRISKEIVLDDPVEFED